MATYQEFQVAHIRQLVRNKLSDQGVHPTYNDDVIDTAIVVTWDFLIEALESAVERDDGEGIS